MRGLAIGICFWKVIYAIVKRCLLWWGLVTLHIRAGPVTIMWLQVGALGQAESVNLETLHPPTWATNQSTRQSCLRSEAPAKISGHGGSGELSWLAIACAYYHRLMLGGQHIPTQQESEDSGAFTFGTLPDSALPLADVSLCAFPAMHHRHAYKGGWFGEPLNLQLVQT